MALTPLSQAYQRSGSGFDAKLSQLVGIGQSIKQSQVAKQKMAQQLEMQKELIGARADATFERQKRYAEEVIAPRQQQQQFQQLALEAQDKANERYKELVNDYNSDELETARKYNLFNAAFNVEADEESGLPTTKIYKRTGEDQMSEIGWQQYETEKNEAIQRAQWLSKLEEGLEKNWFPESYEDQYLETENGRYRRMTAGEANDILASFRNNTYNSLERVDANIAQYEQPKPADTTGQEDVERPTTGIKGDWRNIVADMKGVIDNNGIFKVDYNIDGEPVSKKIEMGTGTITVDAIKSQAQNAASELFGLDLSAISNSNNVEQILRGVPDGLEDEEYDLAEKVQELREDTEINNELNKVFNLYFNLDKAANEWRSKHPSDTYGTIPDNKLYFNPLGNNIFQPVEDAVQRLAGKQSAVIYRIQNSTQ